MAFYADPQFQVEQLIPVAFAVSFGTATASAATGINEADCVPSMPKFIQRTQVKNIRLRCTVIPDAGSTAVKASFMNGTATFGTAILTTATADQFIDATITSVANSVFADDGQVVVKLTGTATASADANGTYDVWMVVQNLYD